MKMEGTNATYTENANMSGTDCFPNELVSEYPADEILLITVILPILLVLGLFTNGAFLFVVVQIKSMNTITNRYLSSLAIADMSYLLTRNLKYLIPYLTVPVFFSEEYMGTGGCIFFPLMLDVTFFVSLAMVTIVSLDRFYAVHKPQENRFRYTRKYSRVIIICSWALCLLVAGVFQIPSSSQFSTTKFCDDWGNKSDTHPQVYAECRPVSPDFVSVSLVCMTIPFFLSMIVNFFLYAWIIYLLNRRAGSTEVAKKSNQQTRNRITIMLVITGILFFLLYSPYELSLLVSQSFDMMQGDNYIANHWLYSDAWRKWYEVCKMLVCSLHIINPIIYNATNRRYREAFARAFCLHDLIYRSREPPSSSYKHPSAIHTTDVTAVDASTQNEVVKLHCFDGPSCKASQDDLDSGD